MHSSLIAYSIPELEKNKLLLESGDLFSAGIIDENQWLDIKEAYVSKLYAPSIFIKIPFFVISMIAISASLGLAAFLFYSV